MSRRSNHLINKRIDVAAPEIYEVLKQIVIVWFNYGLDDRQMINANSEFIVQAEKIIAKIEGRELDGSICD